MSTHNDIVAGVVEAIEEKTDWTHEFQLTDKLVTDATFQEFKNEPFVAVWRGRVITNLSSRCGVDKRYGVRIGTYLYTDDSTDAGRSQAARLIDDLSEEISDLIEPTANSGLLTVADSAWISSEAFELNTLDLATGVAGIDIEYFFQYWR